MKPTDCLCGVCDFCTRMIDPVYLAREAVLAKRGYRLFDVLLRENERGFLLRANASPEKVAEGERHRANEDRARTLLEKTRAALKRLRREQEEGTNAR